MNVATRNAIEPLIRRKIFPTEEDAVQTLVREYVLRQIAKLQRGIAQFEKKYGMGFEQFESYLHERSKLLSDIEQADQRKTLGQAIMREEDDWLDWKAQKEFLDSWLGLRQELNS